MRRFIIVGSRARATPDVRLDDLAGTSGRLDVLLRCVRAALLTSHGARRDVVVYLVMLGGDAPATLRIDGAEAKFIRPDERPLANLVTRAIARAPREGAGFADVKPGVAVACAGLAAALADAGSGALFVLEEGAPDIRACGAELEGDATLVIGDHLGFSDEARSILVAAGARPISVGPVSVHSDDVVTLVTNEIDRRQRLA